MRRKTFTVALLVGVLLLTGAVGLGIVALDHRYWAPPTVVARPGTAADEQAYQAGSERCTACDNARPWKHASIATGVLGVSVLATALVVRRRRNRAV